MAGVAWLLLATGSWSTATSPKIAQLPRRYGWIIFSCLSKMLTRWWKTWSLCTLSLCPCLLATITAAICVIYARAAETNCTSNLLNRRHNHHLKTQGNLIYLRSNLPVFCAPGQKGPILHIHCGKSTNWVQHAILHIWTMQSMFLHMQTFRKSGP